MPTRSEVAALIDHTLLRPEATRKDVAVLVEEARELGTWSVCVSPSQLPVQVPTGLHVACVCGFPSGAHASSVKAAEASGALLNGADEVDMVIDLGLAKAGEWDAVQADIRAVREATWGHVLKVILETAVLSDAEIVAACHAAEDAEADFVKTSTGFHPAGGASVHAVELMRQTVGDRLGVKASGGIRTGEAALAMLAAGATRLGLSASRKVLSEIPE